MKIIAFFNNKEGVGTTTLLFHLAWMYHELGLRVLAVDLDPQASLTSAFLSEERLWEAGDAGSRTVTSLMPLADSLDTRYNPKFEVISDQIGLLLSNLGLALHEEKLSGAWFCCRQHNPSYDAFETLMAFGSRARHAAKAWGADLVLIDVAPSLGALTRAALINCDWLVTPIGTDLGSLQSLLVLGVALSRWRSGWKERIQKCLPASSPLPICDIQPIGYVVLPRPTLKDHLRWRLDSIPNVYHQCILEEPAYSPTLDPDPYRLGILRHYPSLAPLAQAARKPMFLLKPADGAIGSLAEAVVDCYRDFRALALRIADASGPRP